ncbi:hypothetical protein EVAR_66063_1 [Eumeta japonica]|uniref:Uncharacterized protein n=1 Tax=Eumeta variegata TaxID=151549 RepID=A0A4C1ZF21_EUMVA|nr:hypothetical protein EVAR_66063_1 [Eumeta japonica]
MSILGTITSVITSVRACPVAFLYRRVASCTKSRTSSSPAPHGTSTRTAPKHTVTFITRTRSTHTQASISVCSQTDTSTALSDTHHDGELAPEPLAARPRNKNEEHTGAAVSPHSAGTRPGCVRPYAGPSTLSARFSTERSKTAVEATSLFGSPLPRAAPRPVLRPMGGGVGGRAAAASCACSCGYGLRHAVPAAVWCPVLDTLACRPGVSGVLT